MSLSGLSAHVVTRLFRLLGDVGVDTDDYYRFSADAVVSLWSFEEPHCTLQFASALARTSRRFAAIWRKFLQHDVLEYAVVMARGGIFAYRLSSMANIVATACADGATLQNAPRLLRIALGGAQSLPTVPMSDIECLLFYCSRVGFNERGFQGNILHRCWSQFGNRFAAPPAVVEGARAERWLVLKRYIRCMMTAREQALCALMRKILSTDDDDEARVLEAQYAAHPFVFGGNYWSEQPAQKFCHETMARVRAHASASLPAPVRFGIPIELMSPVLCAAPLAHVCANERPLLRAAAHALYDNDDAQWNASRLFVEFISALCTLRVVPRNNDVIANETDDGTVHELREIAGALCKGTWPCGTTMCARDSLDAPADEYSMRCRGYVPFLATKPFAAADLLLHMSPRWCKAAMRAAEQRCALSAPLGLADRALCALMTRNWRLRCNIADQERRSWLEVPEAQLDGLNESSAKAYFYDRCVQLLALSKARSSVLVMSDVRTPSANPILIFFDHKRQSIAKVDAESCSAVPCVCDGLPTISKSDNPFGCLRLEAPAPPAFYDGTDACRLLFVAPHYDDRTSHLTPQSSRADMAQPFLINNSEALLCIDIIATLHKTPRHALTHYYAARTRFSFLRSGANGTLHTSDPTDYVAMCDNVPEGGMAHGYANDLLHYFTIDCAASTVMQAVPFMPMSLVMELCIEQCARARHEPDRDAFRECVGLVAQCRQCSEVIGERRATGSGRCAECDENAALYAERNGKRKRCEEE